MFCTSKTQTCSNEKVKASLQGVNIARYAELCISYGRVVRRSARLSVCPPLRPSVTRWHWVKKTQARITESSPTDSSKTLMLAIKGSSINSKGFTPRQGVKWEWGRKKCNFQPICRRLSETVQDRTKVTIKWLIGSRIHPFNCCQNQRPWMALNDRYTLHRYVLRSPPQKFEWR